MGSCISPVVANIFMAYLEKTAINTFHTPLTLWVRFVDDTFCVIKCSCVGEFHDHLDGIYGRYIAVFGCSCHSSTQWRTYHYNLSQTHTHSDGFYTERAERSLQAPPKKCGEASTTVVLNQRGFDEVVSRVRWTLSDILTYRRCRRLKKKKGQRPIT